MIYEAAVARLVNWNVLQKVSPSRFEREALKIIDSRLRSLFRSRQRLVPTITKRLHKTASFPIEHVSPGI